MNENKLYRHFKVCNSRLSIEIPAYVKPGCNLGDPPTVEDENFALRDVPQSTLVSVTNVVNELFEKFVAGSIQDNHQVHPVLTKELEVGTNGHEKRRHLQQTSSIIGILELEGWIKPKTCFIEYGAGKASTSYWIAVIIENLEGAKVLVIDRASPRNKRDNLVKDRTERIRVDISDLDLQQLEPAKNCESIVGVSKHLCGGATDLALRCITQGNENGINTNGFIICVCCHHQCTWDTFVGKDWLVKNGIDRKTFSIIIKMVSWCVCGDGLNRNKQSLPEFEIERKRKEQIGWRCKRLLDHARVDFMNSKNYEAKLSFYVDKSVTLENVCITGRLKT